MSPRDVIVTRVNLEAKQNAQKHFTDRYELVQKRDTPILRRGQAFIVEVHFRNGVFNPNHHDMAFIFTFLSNSDESDGSKGVAVVGGDSRRGWMAKMVLMHRSSGLFKVASPSNALVGEWKMTVSLKYHDSRKDFHYPGPIYFLFNPWNTEDRVYMPEENLLDEYVISDVGKVWKSENDQIKGVTWIYGQFDKVVLPACVLMLKKSDINPTDCGDPVKVCRTISYMVNESVLMGNWSAKPCDSALVRNRSQCVSPEEWPGSVPILEQWMKPRNLPAQFGQCFNFAGLTTTVCRALGIATRNVTNQDSGVDKDFDLFITKYKDQHGNEINTNPKDSLWNFHVWNEVYMARPDLPDGYSGWQALDSTPQFLSDGRYQCGPASVAAIKAGDCRFGYDVKVFVAATNADCISILKIGNSVIGVLKWKTNAVGTGLFTKEPFTFDPNGENDRLNIVGDYKYPEGSREERTSLEMARSFAVKRTMPHHNQDIVVSMIKGTTVNVGQALPIAFRVKNNSHKLMVIRAVMVADSVYYNGPKGHNLKREERTISLGPRQEQVLTYTITPREYIGKLVGYGTVFNYLFVSHGDSTGALGDGYSQFRHPKIVIEPSGPLRINQRNSFKFRFRNPYSAPLTECKIYYFAPGVDIVREKRFRNVYAFEEVVIEEYFTPRTGSFYLSVTFECKEMANLHRRVQY